MKIAIRLILFCFVLVLVILLIVSQRVKNGATIKPLTNCATTKASAETDPVPQANNDDAADDPAIWVNFKNPEESKIIGTDKKGGLAVYNLDGKELFYIACGKINNVDVRYGFVLGDDTVDIVAASNRTTHSFNVYKINPDGSLDNIGSKSIVSSLQGDVYGFCLYKSPLSGKFFSFMNTKDGEVEQFELFCQNDSVHAKAVRSFQLHTQTEGMVTDDNLAMLYIGKEQKGIFKYKAEPEAGLDELQIALSDSVSNKNISYDIEGLDIYYGPDSLGYLIASIQGNYSYAIYERSGNNKYIGSFRITEGTVDGVEETDGLAVSSFSFGKKYPNGLLVVQDGFNTKDRKAKAQNFKYVDWGNISTLFTPPLSLH